MQGVRRSVKVRAMKRRLVLIIALMALGLGGCGDTDSSTPTDVLADIVADTAMAVDSQPTVANDTNTVSPPTDTSGTTPQDVQVPEDTGTVDTGSGADTTVAADGALPEGLNGVAPDGPTALPQFTQVKDQNGDSVPVSRLQGQWSVLWFYPLAGTPG